MKIKFEALIKQLTIRSLVSLDKEARLILQFQPSDAILNKLNMLHKPDELVKITIEEGKD